MSKPNTAAEVISVQIENGTRAFIQRQAIDVMIMNSTGLTVITRSRHSFRIPIDKDHPEARRFINWFERGRVDE